MGGSGNDTIQMGVGDSIDLASLLDNQVTGIEAFDLSASGENSLSVSFTDVLAISDTATLRVAGKSADHVSLAGSWTQGADMPIGGNLYHSYAFGGSTLLIDTDINIVPT